MKTKKVNKMKNKLPKKLKVILDYDEFLRSYILNENYKDEIEFSNKLCKYKLTFTEVNQTLAYYLEDRWISSPKKIKKEIYKNAIEVNRSTPKNTLAEYLNLKIKKVYIYPNKADSMVKIKMFNGVIELSKDAIMSSKEFRSLYYIQSKGTLLKNLKADTWSKLITYWTKKYGQVIQTENVTEDQLVKEKLIEEIENFTLVKDIRQCTSHGKAYLDENGFVLIPSFAIENIIKKNKWQHKLTRVSYWIEAYLAKPSTPKRVGRNLMRFWHFKKDKLNIDYNSIYGEEND